MELMLAKSAYVTGRNFEYRTRDYLKDREFFVIRSPVSKSPVDLVAVRKGEVLFVQCKKGGYLPKHEWNPLLELAESVGAKPILATIAKKRGSIVFEELLGPKDGSGKKQPKEIYEIE